MLIRITCTKVIFVILLWTIYILFLNCILKNKILPFKSENQGESSAIDKLESSSPFSIIFSWSKNNDKVKSMKNYKYMVFCCPFCYFIIYLIVRNLRMCDDSGSQHKKKKRSERASLKLYTL